MGVFIKLRCGKNSLELLLAG